ncbi:MAG TPA: hypothetical protein VKE88_04095 [Candidatus Nanoarchaeia archaeon]|nr:hypothetical protein [Candidatus Nanoarchaeia archaeon]
MTTNVLNDINPINDVWNYQGSYKARVDSKGLLKFPFNLALWVHTRNKSSYGENKGPLFYVQAHPALHSISLMDERYLELLSKSDARFINDLAPRITSTNGKGTMTSLEARLPRKILESVDLRKKEISIFPSSDGLYLWLSPVGINSIETTLSYDNL